MLFKDILHQKENVIAPQFDKLFDLIIEKQTHDCDLLLVDVNGFYEAEVHTWTLEEKMSPYTLGPGAEGHSDHLHYKFIHNYRSGAIANLTHINYLKELEWSSERSKIIDDYHQAEGISIQLEMLIYLKIWEADLFIKKFYQLVKLANGEPYDWHFRITESNRDKTATGKREVIVREQIRDRFQQILPELYNSFKVAYKTQIRNSIAHSKYSFLGRSIHLNNYIKSDPASQLKVITFDEWIEMFHTTMIIYNEKIRFFKKVRHLYERVASENNNTVQVRINKKDPDERTEYRLLEYRPEWKDWR